MRDEDGVRAVAEVMSMMIYVYYYIYIRSEWVIGWRGKDDLGTVDEDEDVDEDDQEEIEGEREKKQEKGREKGVKKMLYLAKKTKTKKKNTIHTQKSNEVK